jgi:DNA-directed RNA polymerase specialized sigma24 family protein
VAVSHGRRRERPAETLDGALHAPAAEPTAGDLRLLADSELLLLCSQGDLPALGVIYDRYIDAVWSVALTYAGDLEAAERAVEAAFLHVWRQPEPEAPASIAVRLVRTVRREGRARVRASRVEASTQS